MANQGIYHPTYNPNGSKKLSDGNFWYNTTIPIASTMDCFDSSKMLTASGNIGTTSGRPDGIFYDQVAENSILDLRNSSKKVEDYNRLINREFNKLVAGTNRGKEGEATLYYKNITGSNLIGIMTAVIGNQPPTSIDRDIYFVINNSSSAIQIAYWSGSSASGYITINTSSSGYIEVPYASTLYIQGNNGSVVATVDVTIVRTKGARNSTTRTKSNTLLHCDIIGNPANYPTSWKESGVFGTPLIVAEDGTSLLPDGVLDSFKLSRRANATPLLCLRSTDSGVTWTSFTPTFSASANTITLTDEPAANLVMVYYQTHTSMDVPVANSEVLEIGDVFASNYSPYSIINSLINKVPNNSGGNSGNIPRQFLGKPTNYGIENISRAMITSDGYRDIPQNKAISMTSSMSPACKVFPYLTRLNGKAYLNLVFKEMKHNGTSWGDDNKFNIVSNVSTTTDTNAQTVLIGQKTVELPYFIGADE